MNRALIVKTARESALLLAAALVAVVLFEMLLVLALSQFAPELLEMWGRVAFLRNVFQIVWSIDVAGEVSINTLVTIGLAHPFLFAVTWGLLITACTRVPCGEIDRGTADLLLSLPISRASVFVSTTVVWLAQAVLVCIFALCGLWIGGRLWLTEPLNVPRLAMAAVNLLLLLAAIGATTMLVSSVVNRRGVAVGIIVGLLLVSFLINFLQVFIKWIDAISFLGFLEYYRPVELIRDGTWPLRDLSVLGSLAAIAWGTGLGVFCYKDVPVR